MVWIILFTYNVCVILDSAKYKNFINKYIPESEKNGNNDECVVCLEDINYKNQGVYNCITCKNSVHVKCWNLYLISLSRQYIHLQKCSVCRTSYLPCILK